MHSRLRSIVNPAGFYIYLVEANFSVPGDFETSRKRALRRLAQDKDQRQRALEAEEFLRQEAAREEYRVYCEEEIDRYIASNI
ncbi:MAG: hypothetical protein ACXV8O_09840, partial [Methylobacter sp.]